MKTFAHINAAGDVVGIGMIYLEAGGLVEPVQQRVTALGEDAGIVAYGDSVRPDPSLVTVVIDTSQMPGDDPNGYDKTFRAAYKHGGGFKVIEDPGKSKLIAHDMRRVKRAGEFAPLDVQATIPSQAAEAEAKRQQIRDDYAAIQTEIDAAADMVALRATVAGMRGR